MEALKSWKEEQRSAYAYQQLAKIEPNPVHQKLFAGLAKMALEQAEIWAKTLKEQGIAVPTHYKPDWRAKLLMALAKRLGPRSLRIALAAMKIRGMSIYRGPYSMTVPGEMEYQHRSVKQGGNLRAAVFGVSDGLLSNASLILGIAGANVNANFVLLAGIAGLLAGASSMGAGEYVSVRSQRDMLEYQLALEKSELELYPEEEMQELALIYQARGLSPEDADNMAKLLIKNPDKALDTLAREELGINPTELGSPWGAAISSFSAFAIGALLPLLPYLFSRSGNHLIFSIAITGLSLFIVGSILSLFTQRNIIWSGLRMLFIGAGVGCLTYFIGKIIHPVII